MEQAWKIKFWSLKWSRTRCCLCTRPTDLMKKPWRAWKKGSAFLAPTGAQGVTLSVRLSGTKLSRALNLHLLASDSSWWLHDDFRMTQRALSKHSDSIQLILKEHSESNQREGEQSDFVIPSLWYFVLFAQRWQNSSRKHPTTQQLWLIFVRNLKRQYPHFYRCLKIKLGVATAEGLNKILMKFTKFLTSF